jgi:hypothetical protein
VLAQDMRIDPQGHGGIGVAQAGGDEVHGGTPASSSVVACR